MDILIWYARKAPPCLCCAQDTMGIAVMAVAVMAVGVTAITATAITAMENFNPINFSHKCVLSLIIQIIKALLYNIRGLSEMENLMIRFKKMILCIKKACKAGPGCSKLTTPLVNGSLKFQTLISETCQYFLLKKCEKLLQCKSFSHFVNKKYQYIWL